MGVWLLSTALRNRTALPLLLRFAVASMSFLVIEALIGAGTVLTGLTGDNVSVGRGLLVAFHLVNSLLLMGALALATLCAYPERSEPAPAGSAGLGLAMLLGLVGMLVLMFSGGIAAMGNTMFPPETLQAGLAEDFSRTAHPLVRLRLLHPVLAVAVGGYLWFVYGVSGWIEPDLRCRKYRRGLFGVYCLQLVVGTANLALLGPVVLQLLHLALAILSFALWSIVTWLTWTVARDQPGAPTIQASPVEVVPT